MDTSNNFIFNGVDPFDNWTVKNKELNGYYPRNSIVNLMSMFGYGISVDNKTLYIIEGVEVISNSCFRNNHKYREIYIPKSVKKIDDNAFKNSGMTLVVYKGSYAERYAIRKKLKYRVHEETSNQNQSGSN